MFGVNQMQIQHVKFNFNEVEYEIYVENINIALYIDLLCQND